MKKWNKRIVKFIGLFLLAAYPLNSRSTLNGQNQENRKHVDLGDYLDLANYYVQAVAPKEDPKTGFIVGGKNETNRIKKLQELNGRKIADLEKDMRPGAKSEVGSESGFLGKDEKLLDILVMDNEYVVDKWGLTHQELAKHLHAMGTIAFWQEGRNQGGSEFVYHGRRFKVKIQTSKGYQLSPFMDETKTNADATVQNLDNGKKLEFSLLLPYMIERYGFYEGKCTPYRTEPNAIIELFDFLKPKEKK